MPDLIEGALYLDEKALNKGLYNCSKYDLSQVKFDDNSSFFFKRTYQEKVGCGVM